MLDQYVNSYQPHMETDDTMLTSAHSLIGRNLKSLEHQSGYKRIKTTYFIIIIVVYKYNNIYFKMVDIIWMVIYTLMIVYIYIIKFIQTHTNLLVKE